MFNTQGITHRNAVRESPRVVCLETWPIHYTGKTWPSCPLRHTSPLFCFAVECYFPCFVRSARVKNMEVPFPRASERKYNIATTSATTAYLCGGNSYTRSVRWRECSRCSLPWRVHNLWVTARLPVKDVVSIVFPDGKHRDLAPLLPPQEQAALKLTTV